MQEEEEVMEKKASGRSSSVTAQKNGCDPRKQENGNKFGKQAKRREGSGSRTRQEPASAASKKPTPQKLKSYDKRPRPRGYYNDRPRDEVTLDSRAELGSALQQGSKKGNLNHLLNFTFAPRDVPQQMHWRGRNNWSKGKVRYNKEQFLQASCQFIVTDKGDYSVNAADPDKLVDWDLIERVNIVSHEVPSCPICLYHPVAAKMTRCGHIYCWSCILHYLSLGDKQWRKCPICNDFVYKKELKSVMALANKQYNVGDVIKMKLMKRERGSTYAVPTTQWTNRGGKPHNLNDQVDKGFLKLLVASNDDVHEILDSERRELTQQLKEETDSLSKSFIEHAVELLKEREDNLRSDIQVKQEVEEMLQDLTLTTEKEEESPIKSSQLKHNKPIVKYASAFSDEEVDPESEEQDLSTNGNGSPLDHAPLVSDQSMTEDSLDLDTSVDQTTEDSSTRPTDSLPVDITNPELEGISEDQAAVELQLPQQGRTNKMTETYYYYQAADGQHVYMNSLNARCLAQEYKSLEHGPETISAKIIEMESVSMTEELRRRLRYLGHLPVTCPFMVAELDLRPPLLSKETIHRFAGEIDKRRRQRQRKARDERRRFKQWEEKENPRLKVSLQSSRHFPEHRTATSYPVDTPTAGSTPSTTPSTPIGSPPALNPHAAEFVPTPGSPVSTASSDGSNQWGAPVSFAQMLQQGKAKSEAWPKIKTERSTITKVRGSDSDVSDNEDKVPVPEYRAAFGSAIQEALEKMTSPDVVSETSSSGSSGGRKKKGKQKKLLFTTSMSRAK